MATSTSGSGSGGKGGADQHDESSPRFRSVLPHEPMPRGCCPSTACSTASASSSGEEENFGYVHLQGSFMPKVVGGGGSTRSSGSSSNSKSKEKQQDDGSKSTTCVANATTCTVTPEEIERAILASLTPPMESGCSSTTILTRLPPHKPIEVKVVDPTKPPYSKVRVTYDNYAAARDVAAYLRHASVSPSELLSATLIHDSNNERGRDTDNDGAGGVGGEDASQWKFSHRPILATQITTIPLPPDDRCWSRSNPPKFRRLLHTREDHGGENADTIKQTREETRFVFLTNLLDANDIVGAAEEGGRGDDDSNSSNIAAATTTTSDLEAAIAVLSDLPQHCYLDALRSLLDPFDSTGLGIEIYLQSKKSKRWLKSVHVGMRTHDDAVRVVKALHGRFVELTIPSLSDTSISSSSCTERCGQEMTTMRVRTGRLFLDFVAPTHRSWEKAKRGQEVVGPRSDCTSTTDDVTVPGLVVIPDFISEDEEATLLAVLTGPTAPWAPSQASMGKIGSGNVRRRVQHYGYVFDYETADVLRDRNDVSRRAGCPPMPAGPRDGEDVEACIDKALRRWDGWGVFAGVIQRTRSHDFGPSIAATTSGSTSTAEGNVRRDNNTHQPVAFADINQATVNEYKPGQGIGSHVDTPSAFGDGLLSISLSGGTVMEFRRHGASHRGRDGGRKLVHLPARSLCLMSGAARYEWEHMIVSRMTDTVNGVVVPRQLRVSITLRTALAEAVDAAEEPPKPLALVESSVFPPRWTEDCDSATNTIKPADEDSPDISTPFTERNHVHAVYDAIATQWHHTRGKRGVLWPGATQFLKELPRGSVVADVGCGDGKYFPAIYEAGSYVIGSDISRPLLQTAVEAGKSIILRGSDSAPESRRIGDSKEMLNARPAVAVADCMHVPLRSRSVDAAICIAVMHHLSTKARRIRCLTELARVVRVGGLINVQAWAMDQEESSKRKFAATDVFVPFNAQPRYLDKVNENTDSENDDVINRTPTSRPSSDNVGQGVAEMYSQAYDGAEFDERKGLVVFQRYCHLYCKGELEDLAAEIGNVELVESGFESGNYFIIVRVIQ